MNDLDTAKAIIVAAGVGWYIAPRENIKPYDFAGAIANAITEAREQGRQEARKEPAKKIKADKPTV
jgi:hypothetical protein